MAEEEVLAKGREHYKAHREERNAMTTLTEEGREARREYLRRYRAEHREELNAKNREYQRRYREEHREELNRKRREKYSERKEQVQASQARYWNARAAKKSNTEDNDGI